MGAPGRQLRSDLNGRPQRPLQPRPRVSMFFMLLVASVVQVIMMRVY